MKQLLLHHCCAPCSPIVVASFMERFSVRSFWFNPNIGPHEEYTSRYESLKNFVRSRGLSLSEGPVYPQNQWMADVGTVADRCTYCYRLRLTETAREACKKGIDFYSTTLLVSPYQKHDLIRAIGEDVARQFGVGFVYEDFRKQFYKGKDVARKEGSYIQKYCGCLFSREERLKAKTRVSTQKSL
ncbi:MAG: epoxyqueuosine reductase QueH [Endomicrobiales bacterium]|jgi:predicted adenine nucleotide alpha hydrolase (AANH) superfamily ATPase